MQFISYLMFLQKLKLKPNQKVGFLRLMCVCVKLIKRAWSYSLDMLKSNLTSVCSLVSSLHSSSFFIPEHLFASPLACRRSISLFLLCSLVTMWAQCERWCVCLSPLAFFSPLPNRERTGDTRLQRIENACVKHNFRQTDALLSVRLLVPRDLNRILSDILSGIQSNSGSEDKIIFCTLTVMSMFKIVTKILLYIVIWYLYVALSIQY